MTCIEVYSATLLADQEKKKIFAGNNKCNRIDEQVLPPIKGN